MFKSHELGKRGENLAAKLLINKGLTILERNWRTGRTEVDIIATDGLFLIICEVKTRSSSQFGSPDEAINVKKMEALARAGAVYQEEKGMGLEFRFDVINIILKEEIPEQIEHLEAAFLL